MLAHIGAIALNKLLHHIFGMFYFKTQDQNFLVFLVFGMTLYELKRVILKRQ